MSQPYRHTDPQALLDSIDGDAELFMQLSQTFIRNTPPALERLTLACRNGDWPAAARLAHSLKNTADIVGARFLSSHAKNLEVAAFAGGQSTQAEALLSSIAEALPPVYAELRAAMLSISP